MNKDFNNSPSPDRIFLAWLSLFISLGIFIALALTYSFRELVPLWGILAPQKMTEFHIFVILIEVVLGAWVVNLTAIFTWLFFAKKFFTRSELEPVINFGPTTSYDRLLLDKFFPE